MAMHLAQQPRSIYTIPIFLVPALSRATASIPSSTRSFSSSTVKKSQIARGNRDKNRKRGVSVIRSSGPRHPLEVSKYGALPKPVSDPTEARAAFAVNPNHGLWGFFNENKEALIPSSEEDSHGRAWTKHELSRKSLDDLHKLYWMCIKEENIVRTRNGERRRLRVGYGVTEAGNRVESLWTTRRRIRAVLAQRHYAHFDAEQLTSERYLFDIFPDVLQESISPEQLGVSDALPEEQIVGEESLPSNSDFTERTPEQILNPKESNQR